MRGSGRTGSTTPHTLSQTDAHAHTRGRSVWHRGGGLPRASAACGKQESPPRTHICACEAVTARRLIAVQHTTPEYVSCPRIPTLRVCVRHNLLPARGQHSVLGTSCAIACLGPGSACSPPPLSCLPTPCPLPRWPFGEAACACACGCCWLRCAAGGVGHAYARAGAGGEGAELTSAHVRRRVAAGTAGRLLDVVRALATTAAQGVRLVVTLTEACGTLAYNLRTRTRQPPAPHTRVPQLPRRCCARRTERHPAHSPVALHRLNACATMR